MSNVRTNVVGINFNNKTIDGYLYMEMQMLKRANFMKALIVRQMYKLIVLSLPIKVEYLMMDMDRYGLKKNNNKY